MRGYYEHHGGPLDPCKLAEERERFKPGESKVYPGGWTGETLRIKTANRRRALLKQKAQSEADAQEMREAESEAGK